MKRNGNKKFFWKKSFQINKKTRKKQFGRMISFKIAQKQESRSNKFISHRNHRNHRKALSYNYMV